PLHFTATRPPRSPPLPTRRSSDLASRPAACGAATAAPCTSIAASQVARILPPRYLKLTAPCLKAVRRRGCAARGPCRPRACGSRSEEHTSELQSHLNLVCRLLLEK